MSDHSHHHHHDHHHDHHRHKEMEQHREDPSIPAWIHAAKALTIHDLLRRRSREFSTGVISLAPLTTIGKTLEVLQVNNILSAPVFRDRELLGLIDVLDIARFALDFWTQRVARNEWRGYEYSTEEFFQYPVIDVLNYSKLDPPFVVSQRTTVAEAIRLFGGGGVGDGKGMLRPHRVVVLDDSGMVVSILSQSDLVHFIHSTKDTLPAPLKERTMRSLNQVNGCVSVRLDNPFSETLELLYRNKISAVALLDDQYRVCGNFSASDLRGISPKSFSFFEGSTIQFLTKGTKSGLGAPLWVGEDVSLETALDALVENKVHRLYITNTHGTPSGVFSLSDVLAIFAYLITHAPQ